MRAKLLRDVASPSPSRVGWIYHAGSEGVLLEKLGDGKAWLVEMRMTTFEVVEIASDDLETLADGSPAEPPLPYGMRRDDPTSDGADEEEHERMFSMPAGAVLVDNGEHGLAWLRAAVERPTFMHLRANGVRKLLAYIDQQAETIRKLRVHDCPNAHTDGIHCDHCAGLSVARTKKLEEQKARIDELESTSADWREKEIEAAWAALKVSKEDRETNDDPDVASLADSIRVTLEYEQIRVEQAQDAASVAEHERSRALHEVARVRHLIERDRTGLASALNAVQRCLESWGWLRQDGGWGSYSYEERTVETLRQEIGRAFGKALQIAADGLADSGRRAHDAFHAPADAELEIYTRVVPVGDGDVEVWSGDPLHPHSFSPTSRLLSERAAKERLESFISMLTTCSRCEAVLTLPDRAPTCQDGCTHDEDDPAIEERETAYEARAEELMHEVVAKVTGARG